MVSIETSKDVSTGNTKVRRTARKTANPILRRPSMTNGSPDTSGLLSNNGNATGHGLNGSKLEPSETSKMQNQNSSSILIGENACPQNNVKSADTNASTIANNSSDTANLSDSVTETVGSNVVITQDTSTATTSVRIVVTADKTIKLVLHTPKPATEVPAAKPIAKRSMSEPPAASPRIPPIIIQKVVDDLSLKVVSREKMDASFDRSDGKYKINMYLCASAYWIYL